MEPIVAMDYFQSQLNNGGAERPEYAVITNHASVLSSENASTILPENVVIIDNISGKIILTGEAQGTLSADEGIVIKNDRGEIIYIGSKDFLAFKDVIIIDQQTGRVIYDGPGGIQIADTISTEFRTYHKLGDGTWLYDGYQYQYRLEITGRMPNAAVDSTFVYLSNLKSISFARAWRAAGLSSSMEDYFSPEEAVLVEWINGDDSSAPIEGNSDYVIKTDRLNGAIAEAILSHHRREKPDGLLNTESHIILVNETVSGTPLVGQTNHVREVTVYVYYLNMRFHVQGDLPEEHDGIYGSAAITFTIDDNGIYNLKHFVKPESSVDSGADYSAELKKKFVAASEDIAENEEKYGKQLLDGCWKNATDYISNMKAASTAQPGGNPENRIIDNSLSWAGWTGDTPIFLGALNSSELTTNHTMHLPVYKFQSKASLDRFIENHRDTLTMNQSWENVPSFTETAARYTEDFFQENTLVLAYIATDSISYRYGATGFYCDGTSFVLHIEETTGLDAGDSAVAGWFVTVAVANSLIENCSVFDAYLYDPLTE